MASPTNQPVADGLAGDFFRAPYPSQIVSALISPTPLLSRANPNVGASGEWINERPDARWLPKRWGSDTPATEGLHPNVGACGEWINERPDARDRISNQLRY